MVNRFLIEGNFQVDLSKEFYPLITLFQLQMHLRTLHQINSRNTHVADNLHFIMQSACSGVLTEENYIGVGTIFEA